MIASIVSHRGVYLHEVLTFFSFQSGIGKVCVDIGMDGYLLFLNLSPVEDQRSGADSYY